MLRKISRTVFGFLCLWGLTFCHQPGMPALKVGTNHWIGYEALYVAQEKGYFRNKNIKILELTSASQVAKALEQDLIDAAALTLDEAMRLSSRVDNYVILSIFDYSYGGDAIVAQPTLTSVADLVGKRIGLEEGSVGHFMLYRAAQINAVKPDDFQIVPLHINQHQEAFLRGEVDAVVTFEPVYTRLINSGAEAVFSSREIPKEIIDVLVMKRDKEAQFERQISLLLDSWFKTVELIKKGDRQSIELLARRSQLTTHDTIKMLRNIKIPGEQEVYQMLYQKPTGINPKITVLGEFLTTTGVIQQNVEANNMLPAGTYLKNVE